MNVKFKKYKVFAKSRQYGQEVEQEYNYRDDSRLSFNKNLAIIQLERNVEQWLVECRGSIGYGKLPDTWDIKVEYIEEELPLKFMYNGIKVGKRLLKGWWSDYESLIAFNQDSYGCCPPEIFEVIDVEIKNDTDSMTDYFDKNTFYFTPDSKFRAEVVDAFSKQYIKRAIRCSKISKEEATHMALEKVVKITQNFNSLK